MRRLLCLLPLLLVATILSAQTGKFSLVGKSKRPQGSKVFLSYTGRDGKPVADSAEVVNDTFTFKGEVAIATMAFLKSSPKIRSLDHKELVDFFIDPTEMTISLDPANFKEFKLSGSSTQDESDLLAQQKKSITDEMKPLVEAYNIANQKFIDAKKSKQSQSVLDSLQQIAHNIREKFEPFSVKIKKIDFNFIESHPKSFFAAQLFRYKVSSLSLDSLQLFFGRFSPEVKASSAGKAIDEEIKKMKQGSPGATAYQFAANDIDGKPLNLSDFKGKYVLLDFWASWCIPCREGNPHLKNLYVDYKYKGLEIIGVSDDDSKPEAWRAAVEKDQIGVWKHVLRGLKRTNDGFDHSNDISEHYGIHTLPTKILIDKNGKIIGRYGGGGESDEAMNKKLAEVMKTQTKGK